MTPFLIENQLFQIDYTILILVFFLGTVAGSFSHAFADGIIHGRKILRRSKCNHCKKTILWAHLIPIFSYISLKGKCSHCNKKIHFEILIFEVYFAFLYVFFPLTRIFRNGYGWAFLNELYKQKVLLFFCVPLGYI